MSARMNSRNQAAPPASVIQVESGDVARINLAARELTHVDVRDAVEWARRSAQPQKPLKAAKRKG
jgi:hypothetical protein